MKVEELKNNEILEATETFYKGRLKKIRKSKNRLQPIYESFTNAMEAIVLSSQNDNTKNDYQIIFRIYLSKSTVEKKLNFQRIEIEDNGIGFNNENFTRFFILDDDRKKLNNKGTGRVQFLRFFNRTEFSSIYKDVSSSTGFKFRAFHFTENYLKQNKNAIIKHIETRDIKANKCKTIVTFRDLLDIKSDYDFYSSLTVSEIKESFINHYLLYFCDNRNSLPKIKLEEYHDNKLQDNPLHIKKEDIPSYDDTWPINVSYSKMSGNRKSIEKADKTEKFELKSFIISKKQLKENELLLTSKGQKIETKIKLDVLHKSDVVNESRYLFLISGEYLNKNDEDTRGEFEIIDKEEFKKRYKEPQLYPEEPEILLDDIQDKANNSIEAKYEDIRKKNEEKKQKLNALKKMFLLGDDTFKKVRISINDTEEEILKKFYKADMELAAQMDAEMKNQLDRIEMFDPTSDTYFDELEKEVNELVKTIPLQNRTALTHYVARRKLVLDLFGKILDKQLEIQKSGKRNIDEKLLHNLIFQQSSTNPDKSDLWLINEDFIYFNGVSEIMLKDAKINGENIFKTEFSKEEQKHINAFGKKKLTKRPDVLLFPQEEKCIIVEFKAPNVDVTDHLSQIEKYASLIRNYTYDKFKLKTFYGYLIGENIASRDVLGLVGNWEVAHNLEYWYRPSEKVRHFEGSSPGYLYTEVIRYSMLLKRAKKRNEIFISKLKAFKAK